MEANAKKDFIKKVNTSGDIDAIPIDGGVIFYWRASLAQYLKTFHIGKASAELRFIEKADAIVLDLLYDAQLKDGTYVKKSKTLWNNRVAEGEDLEALGSVPCVIPADSFDQVMLHYGIYLEDDLAEKYYEKVLNGCGGPIDLLERLRDPERVAIDDFEILTSHMSEIRAWKFDSFQYGDVVLKPQGERRAYNAE